MVPMNSDGGRFAHNPKVYGWVRMLLMRVYLPLIAIYLVEVGRVTLKQLGFLAAVSAVVTLVANVPTGYLADKWTRKAVIVMGACLLTVAATLYVLFPFFGGALLATIVESLGYAVISGAGEAMIHDTLIYMGRANDYVRVIGRAQSFGLVGNVILVGLTPLTYTYNKRLPFIIGAVAYAVFIYIATTMVEPPRPVDHAQSEPPRNLYRVLRVFVHRNTVIFFIALGALSAMYRSFPPFTNLALKDLGFSPSLFGLMFAAASIVGAINGRFVHYFKRLTLRHYALFDVAMCCSYLLAIGLTRNLVVAIVVFLLNMGFWRIRSIMYQDHLLRRFGNHRHKATLISTLSFFDAVNFWMSPVFSFVVAGLGFYRGFVVISVVAFSLIASLFMIGISLFEQKRERTI